MWDGGKVSKDVQRASYGGQIVDFMYIHLCQRNRDVEADLRCIIPVSPCAGLPSPRGRRDSPKKKTQPFSRGPGVL